jgi:hypothetical protein
MTIISELEEESIKKFTDFNPKYAENTKFNSLREMK